MGVRVTDFHRIWHWRDEKRLAFLEWAENEPNMPPVGEIADDGRFRVHNGRISGNRFILNAEGHKIIDGPRSTMRKYHFNVQQVNPLPEGVED